MFSLLQALHFNIMARTPGHKPYSITFKSFITGHHVYKEVWSPVLDDDLTCLPEPENSHDKYAIKVSKNETVVGHVPREIRHTAVTH